MRLKLLTLALTLAAVSLPSHGEDLLDAYRQARANDPVLAQSDATTRAVYENVPQARALLLPQLNGTASLQQQSINGSSASEFSSGNGNNLNPGHERTRSFGVELDQTILNLADIANLQAAHSTYSAQQQTYEAAAQDLFVRVATAYFTILNDEEQLTFAKANEEAYRITYDQAEQQYKVGIAAVTNVYQAKSYYEAAKAQTVSTENTLENDRQALTVITGQPVGELKKLRPDLPMDTPVPADSQAWVDSALKNNPTLLSAQFSETAAEHDVNAARAGHLPTITASLSHAKSSSWLENGSYNVAGNGRWGNTIGVTLTVPLFQGGAIQSKVRQSIAQRDEAQDSLELTRRQTVQNTINYYNSVIAGISEVKSGKAAVDSAQEALDATKAGFQVGTQIMLDVLNAIQTLTQNQSTYATDRHQLVLNRLLLRQSAGTIDYKDMEYVNSLLQ
ncbi:TolC family outer membrane protein [Dyella caseinilytica]|uniref:TolC family outer membrane protein n=1 Tax=Dyella caseinilytica TaxID=1849581 RepID=A0ABX7GV80_9GAMM|nr:TolC family outer membrane protein [Dyella caseinilytica]QRN54195.1 TolC family outer membrane protein [Dyella caseinilytica]GFZ92259.1 membrane protein [Dyella caseinilytica]